MEKAKLKGNSSGAGNIRKLEWSSWYSERASRIRIALEPHSAALFWAWYRLPSIWDVVSIIKNGKLTCTGVACGSVIRVEDSCNSDSML